MQQRKDLGIMSRYPTGAIIQRRSGVQYLKTEEHGLIPKARATAIMSSKVINGGHDLEPGEVVMHLDMATHGEPNHDRPENLVVIKRRTTKYELLKRSRILFLPPVRPAIERKLASLR